MAGIVHEGPVTIVFTDVASSTDLRTTLGDEAAQRLLARHDDIVRARMAEFRGQEIKALGDGFLVLFQSARKAVAFAAGVQKAFSEESGEIQLRVGVNTGEVESSDGDIYGQAVNAAARIAARAEPGEILVAEVVKQLTGTVTGIRYVDRGKVRLKGFPERWRLFEVEWEPEEPTGEMRRPRVQALLDTPPNIRLTTVLAGPGYGKTALLSQWAAERNVAWHTVPPSTRDAIALSSSIADAIRTRVPDLPAQVGAAIDASSGGDETDIEGPERSVAIATLLCDALSRGLRRTLTLVIDDCHEVRAGSPACRFVEALVRQAPETLHLVLSGRSELPFRIDRLRGQGSVHEITGRELILDRAETEELVKRFMGDADPALTDQILEVTGGWPAAVRLALESIRKQAQPSGVLASADPGGALYSYLAGEVFAREPEVVRTIVRTMCVFEGFSTDMCDSLVGAGTSEALLSLARRGLFVEPLASDPQSFFLNPLVRDFALEHFEMTEEDHLELHRAAAQWFEEEGRVEDALESLCSIQDLEAVTGILTRHGKKLISAGRADPLLSALERVRSAGHEISSELEELAGEALHIKGDWDGALDAFERASGGREVISAGLAWRWGLIHYIKGNLADALAIYERARVDGEDPREDGLLLSWKAAAHWAHGDIEAGEVVADAALAVAKRSGDDKALAAAHTVLAMLAALRGDRRANDSHYLKALDHADKAGDMLQVIRIRTNQGSHHMEESFYEEALQELNIAIRLADVAGFVSFHALALTNRGETNLCLGRLEQAHSDLEHARKLYGRMGSHNIAYPLNKLGDLYRIRGDRTLARAAYEEALSQLEASDDAQGVAPCLAGLALLLESEDIEKAIALVERGMALPAALDLTTVVLAAAWVRLAAGDIDGARAHAREALDQARPRRDRSSMAEALEIEAACCSDTEQQKELLEQSIAIWREIGDPLGEIRASLRVSKLLPDEKAVRLAGRLEKQACALGARPLIAQAAAVITGIERRGHAPVSVKALGSFRVSRYDSTIAPGEWGSRLAAELMKLLVANRCRAVAREALCEQLWPGDDPSATDKRLTAALRAVRSALDPHGRFAPDYFVTASGKVLQLEEEKVVIDIELFFAAALEGLDLLTVDPRRAIDLLTDAEGLYGGDPFEDDADAPWAIAIRQEARTLYIRVAFALAENASDSGDHDGASRYLLRVLERDPYDENAHLALITAQINARHHGEARRYYRFYCMRMEQIDVEAAPFPSAIRVTV